MQMSITHPMAVHVGAVYCNGVKLKHCISFDTEKGVARCYVTDEAGFSESESLALAKVHGIMPPMG